MKIISIIITFRNEGNQVYKTCESFLKYCDKSQFDFICINDASDDNYDYSELLKFDNLIYIENKDRLGVAGSRDVAVINSTNKYVLIIDGHMRVFSDVISEILKIVPNYPNSLFCCQSQIIRKITGTDKFEIENKPCSKGCKIKTDKNKQFLQYNWDMLNHTDEGKSVIPIQCIMGAAYIIERELYIYLHGLNGLQQYGMDEQFLSAKVFMNGGGIYLLKNINIAHIYRRGQVIPYTVSDFIKSLNTLIILYLFDYNYFLEYKSLINNSQCDSIINELKPYLEKERIYFSLILKRTFNQWLNYGK